MPRRCRRPLAFVALLGFLAGAPVQAQRFGGGGFGNPEDSFRNLDRNENDQIDPEEWESMPPFVRRMWEDRGVDLSEPMEFDEFVEQSRAMREEMMSRFGGGRGGFGGPGGGGPGGFGPSGFGPGSGRDRSAMDRGDGAPQEREGENGRESRRDRGRRNEGDRGPFGEGPGANDRGGANGPAAGSKNEKSNGKAAKPRTPINQKLPDQYKSRDTDGDGQIGFYEWKQSDFAGFRKLDHDGDGFLTPRELAKGPKSSVMASAAPSGSGPRPASRGAGSRPSAPPVETGAASSSSAAGQSSPAPGTSGKKSAAETAFGLLDRNKDGTVTEEEWQRSLTTRVAFEKASIAVSFPMSRDEFAQLYSRAYPASAK